MEAHTTSFRAFIVLRRAENTKTEEEGERASEECMLYTERLG